MQTEKETKGNLCAGEKIFCRDCVTLTKGQLNPFRKTFERCSSWKIMSVFIIEFHIRQCKYLSHDGSSQEDLLSLK